MSTAEIQKKRTLAAKLTDLRPLEHQSRVRALTQFSKLEGCGSIIKPTTPILILMVKWP